MCQQTGRENAAEPDCEPAVAKEAVRRSARAVFFVPGLWQVFWLLGCQLRLVVLGVFAGLPRVGIG